MNRNSSPSRATDVWLKLAGMYGADALERKFGKAAPPEWQVMLGRLNDFEIDRAMRRLAYGAKDAVPSLPAFVKLARTVAHDDWDEPQPSPVPRIGHDSADAWEIAANNHLTAHIMRTMQESPTKYGDPKLMSFSMHKATEILAGYKKAWAQDMREAGPISVEEQRRQWDDCMMLAEREIAALLAKVAA